MKDHNDTVIADSAGHGMIRRRPDMRPDATATRPSTDAPADLGAAPPPPTPALPAYVRHG